jgi:hypothetical protein
MCNPAVLLIAQIGAAALGAYSMVQQGRAQQAAGEYQAKVADINAKLIAQDQDTIREGAAIERRRLGARVRAERGEAVARTAAVGIDPGFGSPADLIGDIEQAYRIDRSILTKNEEADIRRLDYDRAGLKNQAQLLRTQGASAANAGNIAAFGSLLDSASTISSRWMMPAAPAGYHPRTGAAIAPVRRYNIPVV